MSTTKPPPSYDIAIIGSGLGGLGAAIALRRAGHAVTVYERYDFGGEVGASLSLDSNGSRFGTDYNNCSPHRSAPPPREHGTGGGRRHVSRPRPARVRLLFGKKKRRRHQHVAAVQPRAVPALGGGRDTGPTP